MVAGMTWSPSAGLGGVPGRRRPVARGDLVDVVGPIEGGHPHHQRDDGQRRQHQRAWQIVPTAERSALFVERRAGRDFAIPPCT